MKWWHGTAALGMVCLLLGGLPGLGETLLLSGAALLVATAVGLVVDRRWLRRDRYDLGELRSFHEREELKAADVPDVLPDAEIACLNCERTYPAEFLRCPKCGWRPP